MENELMIKEFDIKEITAKNLSIMKKQILEIPEMPGNVDQYNSVKDMHIQSKKILPRIEERRKELKAPILERGKLVDKTAKDAVSMVQPLIEMSSSRRFAWEDVIKKEKEEKERIERERLAEIDKHILDLTTLVASGLQYGLDSGVLFECVDRLKKYDVSPELFQERVPEANGILETSKRSSKKKSPGSKHSKEKKKQRQRGWRMQRQKSVVSKRKRSRKNGTL